MKILTISAALLLVGCSTNCFEKAAITEMTVATTREAAVELAYSGKLSKGQAQEVQTTLDVTKATVKKGAALCFQNENDALDLINAAGSSLMEATEIVREANAD